MMNVDNLKRFDWFADVGVDEYQRDVVYVHYMSMDIVKYVQKQYKNVLIHFYSSKIDKNKYVTHVDFIPDTERDPLARLFEKISELKNFYSKNFLLDLFYEVHDKHNALTNLKDVFPEIYIEMEQLYNTYGFDNVYEKLK